MQIVNAPLSEVRPSPTQPRKHFPDLTDLAASVKQHGILQPITARRRGEGDEAYYEIIMGECRKRAAEMAGHVSVPIIVRDMTDEQVREVQLVENIQRNGLDPLDEADSYRELHANHGYTAEQLAEKCGKSRAYVYAKMKLAELGPEGRELVSSGKLSESVALLVARHPVALQAEALKLLEEEALDVTGEPDLAALSVRDAGELLRGRFVLKLADAPFNKADATLVPSAGACTTCPKRTGNQADLFGDVESKQSCTDYQCFNAKRDAAWERQKALAQETGKKVIDGKDAKKVFGNYGINRGAGLIDLASPVDLYDPKSKTIADELAGKIPEEAKILARDHHGVVHTLVDVETLKEIDKGLAKKHAPPPPVSTPSAYSGPSPAEQMRRLADRRGAAQAMTQIVQKIEKKGGFDKALLRLLVDDQVERGLSGEIALRRGLASFPDDVETAPFIQRNSAESKAARAAVDQMNEAQLAAFLVELLTEDAFFGDPFRAGTGFSALCAHFKVDGKQIAAKELAALKTAAKAPTAVTKGSKGDETPGEKKKPAKKRAAKKGRKAA